MNLFSFIVLTTLICNSSVAQIVGGESGPSYHWDGPTLGSNFGAAVASAGDVNGDGNADVIVGAYGSNAGGLFAGMISVYNGATGKRILRLDGRHQGDLFGWSVAGIGDLDQDGHDDIAVGSPGADAGGLINCGSVLIYSGASGNMLYRWNGASTHAAYGKAVAPAGDLNQDGYPDVIIGADGESANNQTHSGAVYIHSGATGNLLREWHGLQSHDRFGGAVAMAGDVDADGFPDYVIGAHGASSGGRTTAGEAYVYSGANGSLLLNWQGSEVFDRLGSAVAAAGDVNRDGHADLLIACIQADSPTNLDCGGAFVFSGKDGALLHRWFGAATGEGFAHAIANVGDRNEDGVDDLLVTSLHAEDHGAADGGAVAIFSGADGASLIRWAGSVPYGRFGSAAANAGDLDGDGVDNLVIGADGYAAGSVYAYEFLPYMQTSAHHVSIAESHDLNFILQFPSAASFYSYRILISASGVGPIHNGVDIPLTMDSLVKSTAAGNYPMPDARYHGDARQLG